MSALPNLPAGCEWPKRPDIARLYISTDGDGDPLLASNNAAVRHILALERTIPSWLEAARREALEECAKHVESLLEYGERDWDAAQLAGEIRALSTPTPADARGTEETNT